MEWEYVNTKKLRSRACTHTHRHTHDIHIHIHKDPSFEYTQSRGEDWRRASSCIISHTLSLTLFLSLSLSLARARSLSLTRICRSSSCQNQPNNGPRPAISKRIDGSHGRGWSAHRCRCLFSSDAGGQLLSPSLLVLTGACARGRRQTTVSLSLSLSLSGGTHLE